MPDWLLANSSATNNLPVRDIIVRLTAALIMGVAVAVIFRASHGRNSDRAAMLATTLILLAVLIAMVSMVIGGSVALAFSLVGALSIVRFRTVVDDTRDTAFVIFAVIAGMAAGAGQLIVPVFGIPIAGLTAFVLSRLQPASGQRTATLIVRLGAGHSPDESLRPALDRFCSEVASRSVATTKQGTAVELIYSVTLRSAESMFPIVTELNRQDGVLNVEIRSE